MNETTNKKVIYVGSAIVVTVGMGIIKLMAIAVNAAVVALTGGM